MYGVFVGASSFNQPIGNWNVSNVTNMYGMFYVASSFNQPLGSWSLNANVDMHAMLDKYGMDCYNYSQTLYDWGTNAMCPSNRYLGADGRRYGTNFITARNYLINNKGWTIDGDMMSLSNCSLVAINNLNPFSEIVINPNPTNGVINISSQLKNEEISQINIYNSIGQPILYKKLKTNNTQIDLSSFRWCLLR